MMKSTIRFGLFALLLAITIISTKTYSQLIPVEIDAGAKANSWAQYVSQTTPGTKRSYDGVSKALVTGKFYPLDANAGVRAEAIRACENEIENTLRLLNQRGAAKIIEVTPCEERQDFDYSGPSALMSNFQAAAIIFIAK